jgi:hypothetical protein
MFSGQTRFPDEASKLLTIGYNLLRMQEEDKIDKGYEFVTRAFILQPTQVSAIELFRTINNYPKYQPHVTEILSRFFDDFIEKKQTYVKQNGYREKLAAAILTGQYLAGVKQNSDANAANRYMALVKEINGEQQRINETSRW